MTRIVVIGAGLMGHAIAQIFADADAPFDVVLHDPAPDVLAAAPQRIEANLRSLGRPAGAGARVTLCASLPDAVAGADVVFEAAPERLELKQAIFAELERHAPAAAILASNSSVIPIGRIAGTLGTASRMVGTHFWNPPYLVALVEVVQGPRTSPETVTAAMTLLTGIGQEAVHVQRDVPGFVGNRLQHALWREAIALVAGGVCDGETVDRVVRASFGRRLAVMGPIENADYVGLDLTLDIHEQILPDLERTPGPSPYLRELVAQGDLGMKTGQGLRAWGPGDAEATRERLIAHLQRSEEAP